MKTKSMTIIDVMQEVGLTSLHLQEVHKHMLLFEQDKIKEAYWLYCTEVNPSNAISFDQFEMNIRELYRISLDRVNAKLFPKDMT